MRFILMMAWPFCNGGSPPIEYSNFPGSAQNNFFISCNKLLLFSFHYRPELPVYSQKNWHLSILLISAFPRTVKVFRCRQTVYFLLSVLPPLYSKRCCLHLAHASQTEHRQLPALH